MIITSEITTDIVLSYPCITNLLVVILDELGNALFVSLVKLGCESVEEHVRYHIISYIEQIGKIVDVYNQIDNPNFIHTPYYHEPY